MLLRFRGPDGMIRLTVDQSDTFGDLGQQLLQHVPNTVDSSSITMSNAPIGGEIKRLADVARIKIGKVGLSHGDLIFINYAHKDVLSNEHQNGTNASSLAIPSSNRLSGKPVDSSETEASTAASVPANGKTRRTWETVRQSALDDRLDRREGQVIRKRDRMCRHGPKGMCDYCQPLDPFNAEYLKEKNIKYLSFHSYLRKINSATNKPELGASFVPPLADPYFRIKPDCPSGHAPWPAGICTKCQPSTIGLQPQSFRAVDHVEFAVPSIINTFINTWRYSGGQRLGYMYGRYEEYSEVPLGIKAVVEAIYEPPQVDGADGISFSEWENEGSVDHTAKLCGLEQVGVIWTDLLDAGKGDGSVVCKRHVDSYFLSCAEIVYAARLQAKHPKPTKWSDSGYFGSNFVTCVISGNETGEIAISAYQMSNEAVEMVRADIIEPSVDPSLMCMQDEAGDGDTARHSRYIPDVYYRKINEYGAKVQENARPAFPVEYLFVTLTHGFPEDARPIFKRDDFPIENREYLGDVQEHTAAARVLIGFDRQTAGTSGLAISNFHLLHFIHQMEVLSKDEEGLLCRVATQHDLADAVQLQSTEGWQTLEAILKSTGERVPKRGRVQSRDSETRLAKRFAAVRLNERGAWSHPLSPPPDRPTWR